MYKRSDAVSQRVKFAICDFLQSSSYNQIVKSAVKSSSLQSNRQIFNQIVKSAIVSAQNCQNCPPWPYHLLGHITCHTACRCWHSLVFHKVAKVHAVVALVQLPLVKNAAVVLPVPAPRVGRSACQVCQGRARGVSGVPGVCQGCVRCARGLCQVCQGCVRCARGVAGVERARV